MKIVIDIDDTAYKFVQDTSFVEDESTLFEQTNDDRKKTLFLFDILDAIQNGTPLPKGHGDLIDRKALMENAYTKEFCSWYDEIKMADTIIEADIESEDKDEN